MTNNDPSGSDPVPRSVQLARGVLGLLAVGVVVAYLNPSWLARGGVHLPLAYTIPASGVLVLLAILLPQIKSIKILGSGVEFRNHLNQAKVEVQQLSGANTGSEPSQDAKREAVKREADRGPQQSIESSRQSLAGSLRKLAEKANLSEPSDDLGELATELMNKGCLTGEEAQVVGSVARVIHEAKQSAGSPQEANEIGLMAQTLQGVIDGKHLNAEGNWGAALAPQTPETPQPRPAPERSRRRRQER